MTNHVALLRGINVGRHQRIAMADLRSLLEGLGHTDVSTYLQSGNALFSTADRDPDGGGDRDSLALEIEQAITRHLGLTIRCLVRGRDDLRRVVDANPLAAVATDPAKLLVTFLSKRADPAQLAGIDPAEFAPDRFEIGEREVYVWCPEGVRDTKLTHAFFEKRLGGLVATARNWNTVTRLLEMMG